MSDSEIKVKDKRMFTPEGELREDFRHLEKGAAAAAEASRARPSEAPSESERPAPAAAADPAPAASAAAGASAPPDAAPESPDRAARVEIPGSPPGPDTPGFADLVAILAEPVALYLGDAELPDGSSAENLEAARIYIDLLDVLRQKTAGNLSARESRLLEDILYQLRLRYVQKRG